MKNVEKFIDELVRVGKSINTVSAYRTDIQQFKEWLYKTTGAGTDNITNIDLEQYIQYMDVVLKRSENTINRKIKSIVQYTKYLNKTGICMTIFNTFEFKRHSVKNVKIKLIDKQDLYKLKMTINASGNKRDVAIFEILKNTGVRCNELVSIEIDDLKTDINGENSYSYINLKTGKGSKNRLIPLNSDVATAISEYMKVRPLTTSKILLQGQRGSLTRLAINKLLKAYSIQSKIELVTPNKFRHTVVYDMVEKGVNIKTIGEALGHISPDYFSSNLEDKYNSANVSQNNL